jgi:DNA-binding MarR family transcriptional regulator
VETVPPDSIDQIVAQWRRERPDLDFDMLAIVGRAMLLGARVGQEFEALARKAGLTRGLTDVLAALRRAGPPYRLTPTDLFNSMMVTSGGMTHRIDRLERLGLVERHRHPDDRRATHVGLTAKGRSTIDAMMPRSAALLAPLKAELSKAQRVQLADGLRRLLKAQARAPR